MRRLMLMALLAATLMMAACSDDNQIASAPDPCANENTQCLSETFAAADWQEDVYTDRNTPTGGLATHFTGRIDLDPAGIDGVSPGNQIRLSLWFDPPLVVTSNVPSQVAIGLRGQTDCCTNVSRTVAPEVDMAGTWSKPADPKVLLHGERSTHEIEFVSIPWSEAGLSEGDVLRRITVVFTLPDTWSDGTPMAAGQHLPLDTFTWMASFDGDHSDAVPPIQVAGQ